MPTLRPDQIFCLDKFLEPGRTHSANLSQMGLGKTATATELVAQLLRRPSFRGSDTDAKTHKTSALVLIPKTTAKQWKEEIKVWHPELSVEICIGTKTQKLVGLASDADIKLINYESVIMREVYFMIRRLLNSGALSIAVLDESTYIKGFSAKRTVALHTMAPLFRYRHIMTGTPIFNTHQDVWGMWKFMDLGDAFGDNFYAFRNTWFEDANSWMKKSPGYKGQVFPKWNFMPSLSDRFSKLVASDSVRFLREDVPGIPEAVRYIRRIKLSAPNRKIYKDMAEKLIAQIEVEEGTRHVRAQIAAAKFVKLQQITGGWVNTSPEQQANLFDGTDTSKPEPVHFKTQEKLSEIKDILQNEIGLSEQVLFFCRFREDATIIRDYLTKLTGETPGLVWGKSGTSNWENMQKFKGGSLKYLVMIESDRIALGADFPGVSYCIFYNLPWTHGLMDQCEGRIIRPSDAAIFFYLIASKTIDEYVLKTVREKGNIANRSLTSDDLRAIVSGEAA